MAKGIKRHIRVAIDNIDLKILGFAKRGGMFSRALSAEGYNGGYRAALIDVLLLLDGNSPCKNRRFWEKPSPKS